MKKNLFATSSSSVCKLAIPLLVAMMAVGCGGDGGTEADVDSGNNDGGDATAVNFRSLQSDVFTPNCAGCHNSFLRFGGLDLSSAELSYANLVGVGSSGKDGATRVITGLPNDSYLIQKLEGASDIVGVRMPQGGAPLPAATITRIRTWIANGALNN